MDALDLVRAAFRRWYIIVSIVLLAVIAALTLVPEPDSTYSVEGSFTLTVVPQALGSTPVLMAQLAQDRTIREQALEGVEGDADYAVFAGDDGFMTVRATADTADTAIALVDRMLEILDELVVLESLAPDDEYELFFRTVSQPGRALLIPNELGEPLYEAEGSGIVGIVGDPASLDDIDTLLQIGDELTEDAVLDAIAEETDAEIRVNVSDRRPVATITSISRSPEGAVAGFDAAIERAQGTLAVLVTRAAIADRADLEVLRGPDDIFVEEGSAGTVLLGLVALSGVFAILIAVFVDALLMRQSRRDDGTARADGELPVSFAQRISAWRSRGSDGDAAAGTDDAGDDRPVAVATKTAAAAAGHVVTIAGTSADAEDAPAGNGSDRYAAARRMSRVVGETDDESVAAADDEPAAVDERPEESVPDADGELGTDEEPVAEDDTEPVVDEDDTEPVVDDDTEPAAEEGDEPAAEEGDEPAVTRAAGSSRSGSGRATSSARR